MVYADWWVFLYKFSISRLEKSSRDDLVLTIQSRPKSSDFILYTNFTNHDLGPGTPKDAIRERKYELGRAQWAFHVVLLLLTLWIRDISRTKSDEAVKMSKNRRDLNFLSPLSPNVDFLPDSLGPSNGNDKCVHTKSISSCRISTNNLYKSMFQQRKFYRLHPHNFLVKISYSSACTLNNEVFPYIYLCITKAYVLHLSALSCLYHEYLLLRPKYGEKK